MCEQKMPEAGVSDAEAAAEDAKVLASRRKASMMQVDTTTTTVDGVLRTRCLHCSQSRQESLFEPKLLACRDDGCPGRLWRQ